MNSSELRYRMLKEATKHRVLISSPRDLKKDAAMGAQDIALIIDDLSKSIAKEIIKQKLTYKGAEEDMRSNGLFVMTQKEMQDFINSVVNERPMPVTSSLIPPSEAATLTGDKTQPAKYKEK